MFKKFILFLLLVSFCKSLSEEEIMIIDYNIHSSKIITFTSNITTYILRYSIDQVKDISYHVNSIEMLDSIEYFFHK